MYKGQLSIRNFSFIFILRNRFYNYSSVTNCLCHRQIYHNNQGHKSRLVVLADPIHFSSFPLTESVSPPILGPFLSATMPALTQLLPPHCPQLSYNVESSYLYQTQALNNGRNSFKLIHIQQSQITSVQCDGRNDRLREDNCYSNTSYLKSYCIPQLFW